jgi:proteasome lid subunit RPN8/RPN11
MNMNLTVKPDVYASMLVAARTAVPLEACGLLAGAEARVTKCYVLTNADASPEHYSMKPEEQFAAVKDLRAAGLKLLGIWHSHPASPARMSVEDMRLAYTPDIVYVILSLVEPRAPSIRAFVVRDGTAHETPVIIEEQKGESL